MPSYDARRSARRPRAHRRHRPPDRRDEFAVLAVAVNLAAAELERDRLRALLLAAGVPASIGAAAREPQHGLMGAVDVADRRTYESKHPNRTRPTTY